MLKLGFERDFDLTTYGGGGCCCGSNTAGCVDASRGLDGGTTGVVVGC